MEGKYYETMQKKELILWEKDVNDGPGFYTEMLSRNRILGILPFTVEETEENGNEDMDYTETNDSE